MSELEVKGMTPEELIGELEAHLNQFRENKYAFQNGLKDLDFDVDKEKLQVAGLTVPFTSLDRAEQALKVGAIRPSLFIEHDDTQHQVLAFDPAPIGHSGFMDCVTHSLAITDKGLFEVGRYAAIHLSSPHRDWGWFLHRRLATPEQVETWQAQNNGTPEQLLALISESLRLHRQEIDRGA